MISKARSTNRAAHGDAEGVPLTVALTVRAGPEKNAAAITLHTVKLGYAP